MNQARGVVIVAGAGMMTGGRILHHLAHHLGDEASSLVVVGYQAEGTLGRTIVEGADRVRIFGKTVPVAAAVHTINGFSAHADADALDAWLDAADPETVVPVHGEASRARRARRARHRPRAARGRGAARRRRCRSDRDRRARRPAAARRPPSGRFRCKPANEACPGAPSRWARGQPAYRAARVAGV